MMSESVRLCVILTYSNGHLYYVRRPLYRAGGTGPVAPVLAGPIFEAPTIFFK